jgi:biofilm protein TabA
MMIAGNIKRWEEMKPYLHERLIKAIEYLATTDFSKLAKGDYPIDGKLIFAKVSSYDTKPSEEKKWEAHNDYIDVQFLASGHEKIGYVIRGNQEVIEDKMKEKDVAFYRNDKLGGEALLGEGRFAIFFPWELHRPGCQSGKAAETVQKVVVKVKAL